MGVLMEWRDCLVHREVLGTVITAWACPDCPYETYHIDGTERPCYGRGRPVILSAPDLHAASQTESPTDLGQTRRPT